MEKGDKKESGAIPSRPGLSAQFSAYLKDHQRVAIESARCLLADPVNSLMTLAVIGIALALPVGFYVALGNVQALGERWDENAQISLFLHRNIDEKAANLLTTELSQWPEIKSVHLISKEQGLKEFQRLSGFAEALSYLDNNPLPIVIEITPVAEQNRAGEAKALMQRLQALPLVELAKLDLEWVQRLAAMIRIGQRLALGLVILLSVAVLLVIGNTIRLEIENRRQEIIVTKLVGGTDAFIRRPFLYIGMLYGLGGGIVASIIVAIGLAVMNEPVATLAGLYQSEYRLLGLAPADMFSLWMIAVLLGFFGAWFSVSTHLDDLEPR